MKTTIDVAGRIVVPKALRDELGWSGGRELEIAVRDGRLELGPRPVPLHLERRGRTLVAVPDGPVEPWHPRRCERRSNASDGQGRRHERQRVGATLVTMDERARSTYERIGVRMQFLG